MFILNIKDINNVNLFVCDKHTASVLIKNNIPILGINDNKYYFMKCKRIFDILEGGEEKFE